MIFLSYLSEEKDSSLFLCKQPFTRNELKLGIVQEEKFLLLRGNYQLGLFIQGAIIENNGKIFDSIMINDDRSVFEKYRELLSDITSMEINDDLTVLRILEKNKSVKEQEIGRKWKKRFQKRMHPRKEKQKNN